MATNRILIVIGLVLFVRLSIGGAPSQACKGMFGSPRKATVVSYPKNDTVIVKARPRFQIETEDFPGQCRDHEGSGAPCPPAFTGRFLLHVEFGSKVCSTAASDDLLELDCCKDYRFLLSTPEGKPCKILRIWDGDDLLFEAAVTK